MRAAPDLSASGLRASFEEPRPLTVGLEEEVMLLDPETLDLAPRADELLARLGDPQRFKPELPSAQLEIVTPPCAGPREAIAELRRGRRELIAAAEDLVRPLAVGAHPFAAPLGELSTLRRYDPIREEYVSVARCQLVSSLQIHVAVGGADRTLDVYNALRPHLPEIAALSANGPFLGGIDTGLASVRPKIAELLPRQGLPPALSSWQDFADALRWGEASGAVPEPRFWWWELRPHPVFGTLEVRVPDAQTRLAEAAGVVAFVHSLVAWLARRHDEGEPPPPPAPTWRIAENRWSANRHGIEGAMVDLESGDSEPTRSRLGRRLDQLEPVAAPLGAKRLLVHARELAQANGATHQRAVGERLGPRGLASWLVERYREDLDGSRPGGARRRRVA